MDTNSTLAYMVGIAIGDGNLSQLERTTRLRISCDTKYPLLIQEIIEAIKIILPKNKVSTIKRGKNCIDVICYSKRLEEMFGWKAAGGPKHIQKVTIPQWIKENKEYSTHCLKGLFQTDGSIYNDRGYTMVNFVTIIPELANNVIEIIRTLGFKPNLYIVKKKGKIKNDKYTVRISKNSTDFINTIKLVKQ